MHRIIRTLAAAALATAAVGALAHGTPGPHVSASIDTPRIDARQARQAERIAHGVASGVLTRHEARHLHAMQHRIARVEHRARADGIVTRHERAHLTRLQDRASRHIRREAHDAQRAYRR